MKSVTKRLLRAVVLPALKVSAIDIVISHHWTGDRMRLNSFRHKGYWYHGRMRELETMEAFACLVGHGDTVVEAGGHIGYVSIWFSKLVGPIGRIFVFEPGTNNLPYIRENIARKDNVNLIEKGCGARNEILDFYQDDLTGQNNSFVKDFMVLTGNSRNAPGIRVSVEARKAEVCRIDDFMARNGRSVDFVKIDTEGYEYSVLSGCTGLLQQATPPKFMVEVQSDEAAILQLFVERGYYIFDPLRRRVEVTSQMGGNLFALHPVHHGDAIKRWLNRDGAPV